MKEVEQSLLVKFEPGMPDYERKEIMTNPSRFQMWHDVLSQIEIDKKESVVGYFKQRDFHSALDMVEFYVTMIEYHNVNDIKSPSTWY